MIGTIIGRIGADAIVSTTANGREKITFSLAENEKQNTTVWYHVISFDEFIIKSLGPYLKKGTMVLVNGEVSARIYQKKTGENDISYEVFARIVKFVGSGNSNSTGTEFKELSLPNKEEKPLITESAPQPIQPMQVAQPSASNPFDGDDDGGELPF